DAFDGEVAGVEHQFGGRVVQPVEGVGGGTGDGALVEIERQVEGQRGGRDLAGLGVRERVLGRVRGGRGARLRGGVGGCGIARAGGGGAPRGCGQELQGLAHGRRVRYGGEQTV